jgi:hypothetical protein
VIFLDGTGLMPPGSAANEMRVLLNMDPPERLRASLVGGVKHLAIRYRLRA